MSGGTAQALRRTSLHDVHVAAGAKLVPFAGWEMPIQYPSGVLAEHRAVRESAGLFDVSHMGVAYVEGPGAEASLQRLLSNDVTKLANGQAQYTLLTNERGGIEDDLICYRLAAGRYLLVLNAANVGHDLDLLAAGIGDDATLTDASADNGVLALQGPLALDALHDRLGIDLLDTPPFHVVETPSRAGVVLATTGYTGERGCEIICPRVDMPALWEDLVRDERVSPVGLGARDTLRLESCYPLHGKDISPETDAISAGLAWTCGWGTGFTGEAALERIREQGPTRRLVALRAAGRGIPRAGCEVRTAGGDVVGDVTSGTMSPTLGDGIALAYVDVDSAATGTPLVIDVRGRDLPVEVVPKPFHKRA